MGGRKDFFVLTIMFSRRLREDGEELVYVLQVLLMCILINVIGKFMIPIREVLNSFSYQFKFVPIETSFSDLFKAKIKFQIFEFFIYEPLNLERPRNYILERLAKLILIV